MEVKYLGEFFKQGVLSVYELDNPGSPSTIYVTFKDDEHTLGITPLCKVTSQSNADFEASMPAPSLEVTGEFKFCKYAVFANNPVPDNVIINAHNGLIRCGGTQFTVADLLASSNDKFTYETTFNIIDMQYACTANAQLSKAYNLTEQLSFDIAGYTNGRRTSLDAVHTVDAYPKLAVGLSLTGNDLLISCTDTVGVGAAKHIAMSLGIAEENISVTSKITLRGIDKTGQLASLYSIIAANPDYSDEPMHVILPKQPMTVIAVDVTVDYALELHTIGEIVTLRGKLALTDEQIGSLRPLSALDIATGVLIGFTVLSGNSPVQNAMITVGELIATTNNIGMAELTLQPGTAIATISSGDKHKQLPLIISGPAVHTVSLD